jgi:excisionase family DNA binding protein
MQVVSQKSLRKRFKTTTPYHDIFPERNTMEPLLNIKEAAAFLHVSEMTIRRWTNQGLLQCYRVGNRRARRFKTSELLSHLEATAMQPEPATVPLGYGGLVAPDGAHIAHLNQASSEGVEVATAFITAGIRSGETVCIVAPDAGMEKIITALVRSGIPVAALRESGRIHLSQGMETPDRQSQFIAQAARARRGGFRVFGDMRWVKTKNWTARDLKSLEEAPHAPVTTTSPGMLFLCQYTLASCTGEEAMVALETHSHVLSHSSLQKNPFIENRLRRLSPIKVRANHTKPTIKQEEIP